MHYTSSTFLRSPGRLCTISKVLKAVPSFNFRFSTCQFSSTNLIHLQLKFSTSSTSVIQKGFDSHFIRLYSTKEAEKDHFFISDIESWLEAEFKSDNISIIRIFDHYHLDHYLDSSNYDSSSSSSDTSEPLRVIPSKILDLFLVYLSKIDLDHPMLSYTSPKYLTDSNLARFLEKNLKNIKSVDYTNVLVEFCINPSYQVRAVLGPFFILSRITLILKLFKLTQIPISIDATLSLISFYSRFDYFIQLRVSDFLGDLSAIESSHPSNILSNRIFFEQLLRKNEKNLLENENKKRFSKEKGKLRRFSSVQNRSDRIYEKLGYGVFLPPSKVSNLSNFLSSSKSPRVNKKLSSVWVEYLSLKKIIKTLANPNPDYRSLVPVDKNPLHSTNTPVFNNPLDKTYIEKIYSISDLNASKEALNLLIKTFGDLSNDQLLSQDHISSLKSATIKLVKSLAIKGNSTDIELLVSKFPHLLSLANPIDNSQNKILRDSFDPELNTPNEILVNHMNTTVSEMYIKSLRLSLQFSKEQWVYRQFLNRWRSQLDGFSEIDPSESKNLKFLSARWNEGSISSQHIFSLLSQGKINAAYKTLRAATIAAKIGHSSSSYSALIRCLFNVGEYHKAMDLFYSMQTVIEDKVSFESSEESYLSIQKTLLNSEYDSVLIPSPKKDTYSLVFQCLILTLNSIESTCPGLETFEESNSLTSKKIELLNHVFKTWSMSEKKWEIQIPVSVASSILNILIENFNILSSPGHGQDSLKFEFFQFVKVIFQFFGRSKSIRVEAGASLNLNWVTKVSKDIISMSENCQDHQLANYFKSGHFISNFIQPLTTPSEDILSISEISHWNTTLLLLFNSNKTCQVSNLILKLNNSKFEISENNNLDFDLFYQSLFQSRTYLSLEILGLIYDDFISNVYPNIDAQRVGNWPGFGLNYISLLLMAASAIYKLQIPELDSGKLVNIAATPQTTSDILMGYKTTHINLKGKDLETTIIKSILLIMKISKNHPEFDTSFYVYKNQPLSKNMSRCLSVASNYINKELDSLGIKSRFDHQTFNLGFKKYQKSSIASNNLNDSSKKIESPVPFSQEKLFWNESSLFRSNKIIELSKSGNILHAMKHFHEMVSDRLIVSSEALLSLITLALKLRNPRQNPKSNSVIYANNKVDLDAIYNIYIPNMQNSLIPNLSVNESKNGWEFPVDIKGFRDSDSTFAWNYFASTESLVIENLLRVGKLSEAFSSLH
ncbi:hypothetical protein AYI68_g991 [Smittium mucronatum]|uniref:Pentatricopeptide repeat-containing protein n=1 Tax=Smittium mucronatum TaxID=133383 RepID=A0A1R0H6T6_9FUNG|nr:hypothetical protein AYI68_g991 [Smittium mucronatum]